jgi:hypothetical protein
VEGDLAAFHQVSPELAANLRNILSERTEAARAAFGDLFYRVHSRHASEEEWREAFVQSGRLLPAKDELMRNLSITAAALNIPHFHKEHI